METEIEKTGTLVYIYFEQLLKSNEHHSTKK